MSFLLWILEDNQAKLDKHYSIIKNEKNSIAVSVVSYWEIVIKKALGKLTVPDDIFYHIEKNDIVLKYFD